jgi:hypothetical protein
MLGDHYRWRKSLPYEGSAHIPYLIQAPEHFKINPGTVLDVPVCIEDIMPTVLEMAEVDVPEGVDGTSLLPILRGEGDLDRPYLHIETAPTYQCLTDGREKFIWFVKDGSEQFFDLVADPVEARNLIDDSDYSARVEWWRGELIKTLADRPEGFFDGTKLVAGRSYPGVRG